MKKKESDELVLSYSRISTFKACHYDHYCSYVLEIQPKREALPLTRGTIVHACLEAYNSGKSWKKEYKKHKAEWSKGKFKEEVESPKSMINLCYDMVEGYVSYYRDDEDEIIANEMDFNLELVDGIRIRGFIDNIRKRPNGQIWLKDYKTFASFPTLADLRFNMQSAIYFWALMEMGYDVTGIEWDVLKASQHTLPAVLKDGSISKAQLKSTPTRVSRFIKDMGHDVKEYQELIQRQKFSDYYQRFEVRYNKALVDSLMDDVRATAIQIRDHQHEYKDMNLQTVYTSSFLDLWQAEAMGKDVDWVLNNMYEPKQRRESGVNKDGSKKESSKQKEKSKSGRKRSSKKYSG